MKAEEFNELKRQYNKAMNALYLELPSSIINDVKLISYEYRKEYARTQIEKDRESDVYRKALIKILGKISSTPSLPLLQDIQEISEGALNTPINLD